MILGGFPARRSDGCAIVFYYPVFAIFQRPRLQLDILNMFVSPGAARRLSRAAAFPVYRAVFLDQLKICGSSIAFAADVAVICFQLGVRGRPVFKRRQSIWVSETNCPEDCGERSSCVERNAVT